MAAELKAKILELVERELKKDPSIQSTDLRDKALKIDKSVANLSGRQFHARYALQVRRRLFGGAQKGTVRRGKGSPHRASDSVHALIASAYRDKRARLESAIDEAFVRAIKSESFEKVSKLLTALERHAKELERA